MFQELTNRLIIDIRKDIELLPVLLVTHRAVGALDDAAQDYAVFSTCTINEEHLMSLMQVFHVRKPLVYVVVVEIDVTEDHARFLH